MGICWPGAEWAGWKAGDLVRALTMGKRLEVVSAAGGGSPERVGGRSGVGLFAVSTSTQAGLQI